MEDLVGKGRIYMDKDGAGRLYISKKIMQALNFEHGEEVKITADPKEGVLVVSKLERKEPLVLILGVDKKEFAEWKSRVNEALKILTDPDRLRKLAELGDEIERLKKEIEELKRRG